MYRDARDRKRSHKILITFLVSYLIVLLIPIIFGSVAYRKASEVVEEEANLLRRTMLSQACETIDSKLEEVERTAIGISMEYGVQEFLSAGISLTMEDRYKVTKVMRDLYPYQNNNFIQSFFIYYKNSDVVITPDGKHSPEFFYGNFYSYRDISFEEWHDKLLNRKHFNYFMPSTDMNRNNWNQRMITYMQSIPLGEFNNPSALVVVLIEEDKINRMLQDIATEGTAYIMDMEGNIIIRTGSGSINGLPEPQRFSLSDGVFHYRADGIDMVISYTTSPKSGWKYVSMIPRAVFMSKANYFRNTAVWIVAFCFCAGIAAAVALAIKNYSPIRHIVDTISTWLDDVQVKNINELEFIRETILASFNKNKQLEQMNSSIVKENEEIKERMNRNRDIMKNSLLTKLLKGRADDCQQIRHWLGNYDVELPYDRFLVILFHIDDCSRFVNDDSDKEWGLVRFVIESVAEEVFNEKNKAYTMELEFDTLALIANISDKLQHDAVRGQISGMAARVKDILSTHFMTELTIGIGGIQYGMEGIFVSYQQALKAMDYKIVKGSNSILHFDEIINKDKDYYYPIELELQLINLIKAGRINECNKVLEQIFQENFHKRKLSLKLVQYLFFDILGTAVKTLDELRISCMEVFGEDFDPVETVTGCNTVGEIYLNIKEMYRAACIHIQTHKTSRNTRLKKEILLYIDNHYTEELLCQTMISDHLGVSPSYLSKFFKHEMGENMSDYINKIRIRKAKFYLQDSRMPLSEVAQKVGYGSDRTLIRTFKQYEGITPGSYRNNLLLRDDREKEMV